MRPSSSSWDCQSTKAWHTAVTLFSFRLESDLNPEVLVVAVPPCPVFALPSVNVALLQLEGASLVWFCCDQQVLIVLVRLLHLLLVRAHEADSRDYPFANFGILQLKKQSLLTAQRVSVLRDVVAGASNLDQVLLDLNSIDPRQRSLTVLAELCLTRGTTSKIGLMFATLSMSKI